jgi:hypothetical protein
MATVAATISYHLRSFSSLLFVLSEHGPATDAPLGIVTPDLTMRMHEILRADAEYLNHMRVYLGHRLHPEVAMPSTEAKMIGDGTSASR